MAFFQTKPNLPDGEKARIEFHFQQLADHLGIGQLLLPVVDEHDILTENGAARTPLQVKDFVGEHLGVDVSGFQVQVQPPLPVKQASGGG